MTIITLEVPDDLAQKLQQFNPATLVGIENYFRCQHSN